MACGSLQLRKPFCIEFVEFARGSDRSGRRFCITANRVIDLLTVNRHIAWGVNSNSNFITPHFNDRDAYIVTDNDRFVALP